MPDDGGNSTVRITIEYGTPYSYRTPYSLLYFIFLHIIDIRILLFPQIYLSNETAKNKGQNLMKKFFKALFYVFITIYALFCSLVVLCAFRPDITDSIARFLYPEQTHPEQNIPGQNDPDPAAVYTANTEKTASDYVPPNQSDISIPDNVSGRNGYQQIQDSGENIAKEDAALLQSQLDTGSEGDGLTFDARFYPYYAMLTDTEQHLYRQIYANAKDLYPVFSPVEAVTSSSLKNVFSAVYNDHPELFWLETTYAYKYLETGQCIEIALLFNRTAADLETARAFMDHNANILLEHAQTLPNDYEKERFIHDSILNLASYNIRAEMNQSAYSALAVRQSVCAGYARAFQYLLQQLGIPAYYCTGYAGENHAWNIVELDGEYYNVDTTWDDTGLGTYDYFNKSDDTFASTHLRQDLSVNLPPCNGEMSLEQETPIVFNDTRRSLADVGMTEDQILTSLSSYYADCYSQIVQNGTGTYTFYNVMDNYDLTRECVLNYESNDYIQGYMEDAAITIGASVWEVLYEGEPLQDGRYLMIHIITIN